MRDLVKLTMFLSVALFACGDDNDNPATPDAPDQPDPDGPAPDPDGPAPHVFKGFNADEGGEVRMEYAYLANGNIATRVTGFLYKDPGSVNFHQFVNLNGCSDVRDKSVWPFATNPLAERVYADPGSITISGGPQALQVPRNNNVAPNPSKDPFDRAHPANQWFHLPINPAVSNGTTFQKEKTSYYVTFGGSQDVPPQVFPDVLYSPADFQLLTPTPDLTPVPLVADTDQTFTWTTPDQGTPPAGDPVTGEYEVNSLVAFLVAGVPQVVCIEPNDGSITVPANLINQVRSACPTGCGGANPVKTTLARQTLTHVVRELNDNDGPTGRRIDFITVWCYAGSFVVAAPAAQ